MARFHIIECEHRSSIELFGKGGVASASGVGSDVIPSLSWKGSMNDSSGDRKGAALIAMRGSFDEFFPSHGDCTIYFSCIFLVCVSLSSFAASYSDPIDVDEQFAEYLFATLPPVAPPVCLNMALKRKAIKSKIISEKIGEKMALT
jgi:hypothetical protein